MPSAPVPKPPGLSQVPWWLNSEQATRLSERAPTKKYDTPLTFKERSTELLNERVILIL